MRLRPIMRAALPICALAISACSTAPGERPLGVRPEMSQCPAFPMPPAELMKRPTHDWLAPLEQASPPTSD